MTLSTQTMKQALLISHTPDAIVDLDSDYFFCSSSGVFDQERLEFVTYTLFHEWFEKRYSLHQLSEYVAQFGIEIWTAPDVKLHADVETGLEPFAFILRFTKELAGEVLIQCELYRHDKAH